MRNKLSNTKTLLNIARIGALALCFLLVFAFALTGDVFTDKLSSEDVAFAAVDDGEGETVGGAASVATDTPISAATMSFPGSSANTRTWTYQETTANTAFGGINTSASSLFFDGSTSDTASGEIDLGDGQTIGSMSIHIANTTSISQIVGIGAWNYRAPTFVRNLLTATKSDGTALYTVTVNVTANVSYRFRNGYGSYRRAYSHLEFVESKSSYKLAKTLADERKAMSASSGFGDLTDKSSSDFTQDYTINSTVTLTAENQYIFIATLGRVYSTGKSSHQLDTTLSNLTFNYTVKLAGGSSGATFSDSSSTSIEDGASPRLVGYTNAYPYRSDNSQDHDDWAYYPATDTLNSALFGNVLSLYTLAKDVVSDTNTSPKLYSYTKTAKSDGPSGVGDYYKKLSVTLVDYYNYTYDYKVASGVVGDSVSPYYASGIQKVTVGESTFYLYNTSAVQSFTVDGVAAGWYKVNKTNRARVTVDIYFATNSIVNVQAYDYGNSTSSNVKIDVRGIDTTTPNGNVTVDTMDGYSSSTTLTGSGWDAVKWYNSSTLVLDIVQNYDLETVEDNASSPYAWFYSVVKTTSPTGTLTSQNWTLSTLLTKVPFAAGNVDKFIYDFKTGYASPTYNTDGTIKSGVQANSACTGAGYYLFTFYTMDLAGNYGSNKISYYVKADYAAPEYTLTKSAGSTSITKNTDWAAGAPLTLKLTQNNTISLSGNTLVFEDFDGIEHSVSAYDGNIIAVDGTSVSATSSVTIGNTSDGTACDVSYAVSGTVATWTVVFGNYTITGNIYYNFNYVTTFTVMVGTDPATDTPVEYIDKGAEAGTVGTTKYYQWQYSTNDGKSYVNGVYVRCDRNVPETPEFGERDDATDSFIEAGSASLSTLPSLTNRHWYTDSWHYNAQLVFSESLLADFGDEINVYIGIKNITSVADFSDTASGTKTSVSAFAANFANGYSSLDDINFTKLLTLGGSTLSDVNDLDVDLLSSASAGMRVFYVWAVDQAGNCSGLDVKYILADASSYYVRGYVDNSYFNAGTINNGATRTAYKRGGEADFGYTVTAGYVAYQLERRVSGGGVTPYWTTTDPLSTSQKYSNSADIVSVNGTDFTLAIDSVNSLGSLSSDGSDINVYFVYRKVVTFNVTSYNVAYAGAPTSVPVSISDATALGEMSFDFYQYSSSLEDWVLLEANPTNVGTYNMAARLDSNHYIAAPTTAKSYTIRKADVTINVNASTGEYGDQQILGYTVNGLAGADLTAWDASTYTFDSSVTLSLPNASCLVISGATQDEIDNLYNTLNVGTYQVVTVDGTTFNLGSNYNVSYVGASHVINKCKIKVQAFSSEKNYGDADGEIQFAVYFMIGSDNNLPASITESDYSGLASIFLNAEVVEVKSAYIKMRSISGTKLIVRASGENVGVYDYTTYTGNFSMGDNYEAEIELTASKFTVNKRPVTVTPTAGQVFYFNSDESYDITYTLGASNMQFASELTNVFILGTQFGTTDTTSDANYDIRNYPIIVSGGGTVLQETDNIVFSIADGNYYCAVKKLKDSPSTSQRIITLTQKKAFSIAYGESWNSSMSFTTAEALAENFDVSVSVINGTALPDGLTLSWTATVAGSPNASGYYNVGTYSLNNGTITVGGIDSSNYMAVIGSTSLAVAPASISVKPTATKSSAVYGSSDSVFGLGFTTINVDSKFSSVDFASIFSGSFVRAVRNADGEVVRLGAAFDPASDGNGQFVLSGVTYSYGVDVSTAFKSSDSNFVPVVDDEELGAFYLVITKYAIEVNSITLPTKSKVYDGNNLVKYATGEKESATSLSSLLARGTDVVYLDFTAVYGTADVSDNTYIDFSNIVLMGADAGNYKLTDHGDDYDGVEIRISILSDGGNIQITANTSFTLLKSDFSISKVYDGTTEITVSDVVISDSCLFYGSSGVQLLTTNRFNGKDVTTNYSTNIILFIPGVSNTLVFDEENSEDGISVEFAAVDGVDGLKITINNLSGKIVCKSVTVDDVQSVAAVNRRYNGTSALEVEFVLNNGLICTGDLVSDLGLTVSAYAYTLSGVIMTPNGAAGERSVWFDDAVIAAGSNYAIGFTLEELNAKFSGTTVIIDKARVELNISFNQDKQYSGNTATNQTLTKVTTATGGDVTNYGATSKFVLYAEDAEGFDTNAWATESVYFNFDWSSLVLKYTVNGEANANVVFNGTSVAAHNVSFSGLKMTLASSYDESTTNAILANYEIYGYVYNTEDDANEYVMVSRDLKVETDSVVANYELLGVAPLAQKLLTPTLNGIKVASKVYDGTKNATVTLEDITLMGVPSSEKAYLDVSFNASFRSKDNGSKKSVDISINSLVNTAAVAAGADYTKNYVIDSKLPCVGSADIYKAPLAVTVAAGSKVYDGANTVAAGNVNISLNGFCSGETDVYNVIFTFATYDDVNVSDDSTATAYGLNLISTTNANINYYLVYSSDTNGATEISYVDASTRNDAKLGALNKGTAETPVYYYALVTSDVYILTRSQFNALSPSRDAIGSYVRNGVTYFVVDGSSPLAGYTAETVNVYESAKGSITPKTISVSVTAVDASAFAKAYDGTDKFLGDSSSYSIGDTSGFCGNDKDYIVLDSTKIQIKYLKSNAGSTSVQFSFGTDALKAKDGIAAAYENAYKNYTCENSVALVGATVTKLNVNASLANTEFVYGSAPASYNDKVTYKIGTAPNEYTLAISGTNGYLAENDYKVVFANYITTFADAEAVENMLLTKLYTKNGTEFVKAETRETGVSYFVKLDGTYTAPTVETAVTSANKVGSYAYKLKGGVSTNYNFTLIHTGSSNSTIAVTKATLKVSAANTTSGTDYYYAKYYGYASPSVKFNYSGFVNNDGVSAVKTAPVAEFRLYTGDVADSAAIASNAAISADLPSGSYYGVYFVSYGSADNYNIVLDTTQPTAKLNVTIEPLGGVTFSSKSVAYDGSVKGASVIGTMLGGFNSSTMTVTYDYFKGVGTSKTSCTADALKSAGYYTVVANVVKPISGSTYNQTATLEAVLTVNKLNFTVKNPLTGVNYDGKSHEVSVSDLTISGVLAADLSAVKDSIEISYLFGEDVPSEMKDAGTYAVTVTFTSSTNGSVNDNYNSMSYTSNYIISPVQIVITSDAADNRQLLDNENGNTVVFTYDISDTFKALGFTADKLSDRKFKITYTPSMSSNAAKVAAGSYGYEISYTDTNYCVIGNARGTLILGAQSVICEDAGTQTVYSSATMQSGVFTSTGLTMSYVVVARSNSTEELNSYWKAVDAYMPGIADKYHSTTLASVVQVKMLNGSTVVQPGATVDMKVMLPSALKNLDGVEIYYVNSDGGLTRLSNYTYENHYISYATDYISSLVFVRVTEVNMLLGLPMWLFILILVLAVLVLAGIIIGIILAVKKKKKDSVFVPETAGTDSDAPLTDAAPEEPVEDNAMQALPYEEPEPAPAPEPTPEPTPEPVPEPTPEPTPEPEPAPAPKVRPAKPTHVGKKKPPVIGVKDMDKLNERSVSAAPEDAPSDSIIGDAPVGETPAAAQEAPAAPQTAAADVTPEAPAAEKKAPPVVGKKKPPVVGKKPDAEI